VLVALIVMAAAGTFALTARRVEAQLLYARGEHPAAVSAKSCLESVVPAAVGGTVGLGLSFLLVRLVLPDGPVPGSAVREAVVGAGLAALASLLLIGVVSAVAFLRHSEHHRVRFGALARVPWELAFVAFAAYALQRLRTGGAFVQDPTLHVRRPSVFVLLFPIIGIAGVGGLLARGFGAAISWVRSHSARLPSWSYLAVHRLAGGAGTTLVLVSAAALCLGVFVQAQTTVRSLQTTVDAKAHLFVGSDVQARVQYTTPSPKGFPMPITRVTLVSHPGTLSPGLEDFDLLAIDPETFARAAYWNPTLSDVPLDEMLHRVAEPARSVLPVVIAGGGGVSPLGLEIEGRLVPVRIVDRARAFPGIFSRRPLVVADERSLLRFFTDLPDPLNTTPGASTQFWVRGDPGRAQKALAALRFGPDFVITADQVMDIPEIAVVIQTLLALKVLGVAASLLVVIGMLMYLAARQRSQIVSYGLSLRMGMTHAQHRHSLVAELATMLCSSFAIALGLSIPAALVVVPKLDPLTGIPPGPIFDVPVRLLAISFVALVGVAWLGGWFTNLRARGADLGEVMRVAE
jgi:putative ABC transport system permease protein